MKVSTLQTLRFYITIGSCTGKIPIRGKVTMELEQFTHEILLGKEKILITGDNGARLLKHTWDEKRHNNAEWELHLILSGTCRVDIDDQHRLVHAGQLMLIAPGQYHRPKALAGAFERFSLSLTVQESQLLQQLQNRIPASAIITVGEPVCRLARNVVQESTGSRAYHRTYCKALLTQFVVDIFRTLDVTDNTQNTPEKAASSDLTARIDNYFEQHFADTSGEKALADILHMSRRHLIRVLQENYGMTFRQKLIHTRMDYAAWLLRTTSMKISQISSTVGYSSEAAFFRVFRQNFGLTPKQYRAKKKAK